MYTWSGFPTVATPLIDATEMLISVWARGYTVTGKLQLAVWPIESVTVQVTVVVPIGKSEPDGGTQVTTRGGTPPPTIGAGNVTCAPQTPGSWQTLRARFAQLIVTSLTVCWHGLMWMCAVSS